MSEDVVLVVEDEEDIRELVVHHLRRQGLRVLETGSGEEGLDLARRDNPDLVLLDLMLPGMDGLEVCRRLKDGNGTRDIPVIMVTARGEESDVVEGLELGADDYVTKPFSPRVLMARVAAVLRRASAPPPDETKPITIHDITIHPGRHEVRIGEDRLDLTATEFRILQFLARRPGWVYTRRQIVEAAHGDDYPVSDRSVDVQIVGLRRKLGDKGSVIETVRGVGYRFRE